MSVFRWLWTELSRPRGHQRHRFHRVGRRSKAGVALLMVITSILMLTLLVAEISHGAAIRLQLAQHHRDEVKAQALAQSGVQMYRLILMASKQLGKNPMIMQVGEMMGINADSLWQMIPTINTGMMRMIFVSGGNADKVEGGISEEQIAESREKSSAFKRNFLDFDGDFQATVEDENQFMFVGRFPGVEQLEDAAITQQLRGLMSGEANQQYLYDANLNKEELIANLADWTDPDDLRRPGAGGGRENSLYERLDSPYRAKNGPFDTVEEIRLVDGWHLDGVWERFCRHLTIYGGGKVNVNTAKREVIAALLQGYTDAPYPDAVINDWVKLYMQARNMPRAEGGVFFTSGSQFHQYLTEVLGIPLNEAVKNAVTGESTTFRVTSTGEVGEARVQITVILDYSVDPTGEILYWSMK